MTCTAGRTASMTIRRGQLLLKGNDKPAARPVVADDVSRSCQSSPTTGSYTHALSWLDDLNNRRLGRPAAIELGLFFDRLLSAERARCRAALAVLRKRGSERGQSAHSALTEAIVVLKALT